MVHASQAGAAVKFANGMTGAVSGMSKVMGGAALVAAPIFLGRMFFDTFVHGAKAKAGPKSGYTNFNPTLGF